MQKERIVLLNLIKEALQEEPVQQGIWQEAGKISSNHKHTTSGQTAVDALTIESALWCNIIRLAREHAVLPLLYNVLAERDDIPKELWEQSEQQSRKIVARGYRFLFLDKYITELLGAQGITAITLKGLVTATRYPVPELRKAGDIDILVTDEADFKEACDILVQEGFHMESVQHSLHHTAFANPEGIVVELHGMLAEPFSDAQVNQFLKELLPEYTKTASDNTYWGVTLKEPAPAYHAFYLILHMLQHFLRAGFGLKNLCDWVVFWNQGMSEAEQQLFASFLKQSKTEGFVRILTAACVRYLGLRKEQVEFLHPETVSRSVIDEFIAEIFESEEFGKADKERMVAVEGTGLGAYAKEFHHQMCLNYPKASRIFLIWPVLWICTLHQFLKNNRTLRKISSVAVLKKARKRGKLVEQMRLFQ